MRQFKTKRLFVFGLMLMIILGFAVGAAEVCVQPPSNLLSWWAGEGNADPVGELMGGTTFSSRNAGQAFSFDGKDDYLAVPSQYVLGDIYKTIDFKKDSFSFVAWIRTSVENANNAVIFAKCPGEGCDKKSNGAALFQVHGNKLYFAFEDLAPIKGAWEVTKDLWHLVAVTSNADTDEIKLYMDLFLDATASVEPVGQEQPGELLNINIGGHPGWGFFKGDIDEVSIYNRVLSIEELTAIYNAGSVGKCNQLCIPKQWSCKGKNKVKCNGNGNAYELDIPCGYACKNGQCEEPKEQVCVPKPQGLIGWWQGEYSAKDVFNKNNGNFYDPQYEKEGKVEAAFSMLGGNSYIEIKDNEDFAVSDLTIEAWVKPTDITGSHTIISKYNFKSKQFDEQSWYLQMLNNALIAGIEAQADGFIIQSNPVLSKDVWQHVAVVYGHEAKRLEFYVDGKKIVAQITAGKFEYGALKASKTPLLIGAIFSEGQVLNDINWKGDIDEVSIYNRALSANEIKAIYDAGSAGKCKAPECGNGKVEDKETCDDGNDNQDDGCFECQLEGNEWSCSGEPSKCIKQAPQPPGGACAKDDDCSEGNVCKDAKCTAKPVPKEGICGDLDQLQPTDKTLATEIINALKNPEYSPLQKLNAIVMALKEWFS